MFPPQKRTIQCHSPSTASTLHPRRLPFCHHRRCNCHLTLQCRRPPRSCRAQHLLLRGGRTTWCPVHMPLRPWTASPHPKRFRPLLLMPHACLCCVRRSHRRASNTMTTTSLRHLRRRHPDHPHCQCPRPRALRTRARLPGCPTAHHVLRRCAHLPLPLAHRPRSTASRADASSETTHSGCPRLLCSAALFRTMAQETAVGMAAVRPLARPPPTIRL